jgi:hypothetical protein
MLAQTQCNSNNPVQLIPQYMGMACPGVRFTAADHQQQRWNHVNPCTLLYPCQWHCPLLYMMALWRLAAVMLLTCPHVLLIRTPRSRCHALLQPEQDTTQDSGWRHPGQPPTVVKSACTAAPALEERRINGQELDLRAHTATPCPHSQLCTHLVPPPLTKTHSGSLHVHCTMHACMQVHAHTRTASRQQAANNGWHQPGITLTIKWCSLWPQGRTAVS